MDPQAELQHAIRNARAVIVAGTGISMTASREPATGMPHPQSSWAGLLNSGLEWLAEHTLIPRAKTQAYEVLLQDGADTHHFISAAQDIVHQMGGAESKHFAEWLRRTVGTIRAHDKTVLNALQALRAQGNLLATTNYDSLLLDSASLLKPVTWTEPDAFIRAVRNKATDTVLFLHGHWLRPDSVILDWRSYQDIARDDRYRNELATIWQITTWVYVGCGLNGLKDPDLGLLLERYGRRARQAELWDFCLVRNDQRDAFQAYFDTRKLNIHAISFGDSYDQLAHYLLSLLPPVVSPEPSETPAHRRAFERPIPRPPAFCAAPDYIGSHAFVGRASQLQDLNDWAQPADPTNLLLYDAIGGNGKSMLTWEWTTKHAPAARSDWAGRFWYSFYERGAVMADFCRRALAYMTSTPLNDVATLSASELAIHLLAHLHAKPWLIVLDGVERLLVAYHRIDAAEVSDDEVNLPTDKVLARNPCDAIRDEDSDLFRGLAAASPSKILVSSRLVPRTLLNQAGQPIPGARRITLPGLRPADAELLFWSCGISGDSDRIQNYLTQNCDNHPLVIGVLAGLVANYLPSKGNFDAWLADTSGQGGAMLNLASLDLVQRRNHILRAALDALPEDEGQLLSTLALLSDSVEYATLKALNPHVSSVPEDVEASSDAANRGSARTVDEATRTNLEAAASKLAQAVRNLEHRGLLQYDRDTRRHDLHPVVRSIASGRMDSEAKQRYGQRVVDYFSALSQKPCGEATTLEELRPGMHVFRTLIKLERFQAAADAWVGMSYPLVYSIDADVEALALLRPFFPSGWAELSGQVASHERAVMLMHDAANALRGCDEIEAALAADRVVLQAYLERGKWDNVSTVLCNMSGTYRREHQLDKAIRAVTCAIELDGAREYMQGLFISRLNLFICQSMLGQWTTAAETWQLLDPMGRSWDKLKYRQGSAERAFADAQFWKGTLDEHHLASAASLAEEANNQPTLHMLHWLRGLWRLEQGEFALAAASLQEAVRMDHERRLQDAETEAALVVAKLHLGQLKDSTQIREEVERLERIRRQAKAAHRYLAMLWRAIDVQRKAEEHALAAYSWAWADGEPYVNRYELTKAIELLQVMNIQVPTLQAYSASDSDVLSWEAAVHSATAKIRGQSRARDDRLT